MTRKIDASLISANNISDGQLIVASSGAARFAPITSVISEGDNISIAANGRISSTSAGTVTQANLTTANVVELAATGGLYYTNARVYSNTIALLPTLAGDNITIAANGRISSTASGGGGSYGNANVTAYLSTYTGNINASNLNANIIVFGANVGGYIRGANLIQFSDNSVVQTATQFWMIALSDETTAITTGNSKVTVRAPFAMTLPQIPRAFLANVSTSGNVTVGIKKNGTSIFSSNLVISPNKTTSNATANAAVLSTSTFADDDLITFDIVEAGTQATGLKVTIYYYRTQY